MRIVDLHPGDTEAVQQVADILVEGFKEHWPDAWPDTQSALEEVRESFGPERVSRVVIDENGTVLGWIGGISQYRGRVWELHPIVVDPKHQREGIGRALVTDFEEQVRQRGAFTVMLGSDDVDNLTTLSGVALYPAPWEHVASIKNLGGHPYEFCQKLGYVIMGVVPDANGPGKPDILMAKRIAH